MSLLQAVFLAVLQGVTELFPVSSLGHSVVLPAVLHWSYDLKDESFLPFLVLLHIGTAIALLLYFWRDWLELGLALIGAKRGEEGRTLRRLLALIVVATIPAVIVGALFEKILRAAFGTPVLAATFLIVNGFLLFFGERLRRRAGERELADMRWRDAALVGVWQCTALIPGISRSGATMVGGLLRGLNHEASAHFSFLIATPIIFGAAALEVPKLMKQSGGGGISTDFLIAGAIAGVTAFASVAFLMRYFRVRETQALNPFAYYCWAFGAAALALLALQA